MTTKHVNAIDGNQFESIIRDNSIVFIDFWAQWCAPCKQFASVYEEVAKSNPDILFTSVNIEHETELSETFQIKSIPHLIIFKEGIVIYSEAGSMPKSTLEELVQQALEADVSEIREQLDEE